MARQFQPIEISVRLQASFANAYDPDQVALDALVVTPNGRRYTMPGFLYRPYRPKYGKATLPIAIRSTAALAEGKVSSTEEFADAEVLVPTGEEGWKVRICGEEPGKYTVRLRVTTATGTATHRLAPITVRPGKGGFVRVSAADRRYFQLSDGEFYWPLGANMAWALPRGLRDYAEWLPKYRAVGANWGRVWLGPSWTTFGQVQGQAGQVDLAQAARLDALLAMGRRNGIRFALCIDSYNELRDRVSWPEWERSKLNTANGGPLDSPSEFWTKEAARKLYRQRLRYLVARWAADPTVMAWELWNEVDGTADYHPERVRSWHAWAAAEIKRLDPYRHLVTTSFGGDGEGAQDASFFRLPEIDYAQSHRYGDADLAVGVANAGARLGGRGKPHFVGEVGADASGDRADDDPKGLQIHDPLWASIATASSGAAMPWWWDSYIAKRDLYGVFRPASEFLRGLDFRREAFHPAKLTMRRPPDAPREMGDAIPTADAVGWNPADHFGPQTVRIDADGMHAPRLAKLQQGTGNHPELHNPVTFEIDLSWPTTFRLHVGNVSGYGGAALRISLDGKEMVRRDYPDPDGDRNPETLKQFEETLRLPIPAGKHRVTVENPGSDWFEASYCLEGALVKREADLLGYASVGKRTVIGWFRKRDATWQNEVRHAPIPAQVDAEIEIGGLRPGKWRVEWWDPSSGAVVSSKQIAVGTSGMAVLPLQIQMRDVALKMVREVAESPPPPNG